MQICVKLAKMDLILYKFYYAKSWAASLMGRFLPEGYQPRENPVSRFSAAHSPVITTLAGGFLYDFSSVQAVNSGKVFAVVLGELDNRRYSLSAEHRMTRRHLARGTLVIPACCFESQSTSKTYLIIETICTVSKVTWRYLDPWHAECRRSRAHYINFHSS